MKLSEQEDIIKSKISKNREDESIYLDLQNLIEIFLRRKKVCNCSQDYSDLSFQIAGDIYIKVLEGESFNHLLGYLEKVYRPYAQEYFKEIRSGQVNASLLDSLRNEISQGNQLGTKLYREADNRIYLKDMWRVIDETMRCSCKYDYDSTYYLNLKLSLVLSVLRGEQTNFHLQKEQEMYLKLILTNFYSQVVSDGIGIGEE